MNMLCSFREVFGFYTTKYSADYLVWLSRNINILWPGQEGICQCPPIGQRSDSSFLRQKENREVSRVKTFSLANILNWSLK